LIEGFTRRVRLSRVQGKHSHHLPPRECLLKGGPINSRFGEKTMDQHSVPNEKPFDEADERMIRGADAIAQHIFGDRGSRRKVYYLAECSKIPIFRLGSTLCLRPSAYRKWIKDQEARSISNVRKA
jgi:hypothetical protein